MDMSNIIHARDGAFVTFASTRILFTSRDG